MASCSSSRIYTSSRELTETPRTRWATGGFKNDRPGHDELKASQIYLKPRLSSRNLPDLTAGLKLQFRKTLPNSMKAA